MIINYKLNDNNFINYKIQKDYAVVDFLYFDDPQSIYDCWKHYFDYLATFDFLEYVGCYPGCNNPLVIKAALDVFKFYGFNYRIFYDDKEVDDLNIFENQIIQPFLETCLSLPQTKIVQSSCDGVIGSYASQSGFKLCAIFGPLRKKMGYVKTPVKYYKIDKDGFLTEEFDEKPNTKDMFFQNHRLSEMFKICKIKIIDGSLKYYPKDFL